MYADDFMCLTNEVENLLGPIQSAFLHDQKIKTNRFLEPIGDKAGARARPSCIYHSLFRVTANSAESESNGIPLQLF